MMYFEIPKHLFIVFRPTKVSFKVLGSLKINDITHDACVSTADNASDQC